MNHYLEHKKMYDTFFFFINTITSKIKSNELYKKTTKLTVFLSIKRSLQIILHL